MYLYTIRAYTFGYRTFLFKLLKTKIIIDHFVIVHNEYQ